MVFFQDKAGQMASGIRGSVNSDPIGANLGNDPRRVPVHNKLSIVCFARQERLSNVQKIITILVIERDARPYAGMTEEVIADGR